jgi:hypothetical protein
MTVSRRALLRQTAALASLPLAGGRAWAALTQERPGLRWVYEA